jgi:hypothetical protein
VEFPLCAGQVRGLNSHALESYKSIY